MYHILRAKTMIYTLNTKDYMLYPLMKSSLKLSDEDVYDEISYDFETLIKRLSLKKISYQKLKGALIPNQDKDKYETCFVIDTTQLADEQIYNIYKKIIPLFSKESTFSVLSGDYIDVLQINRYSQQTLKAALNEHLVRCNSSTFRHSSQYYLIYINRLSANQRWHIVENLMKHPWFTGFVDVTHRSRFKSYLSYILPSSFIKCVNNIIASHSAEYNDDENINIKGYPFEDNGYTYISINEESFNPFLSYKIESEVPDTDDIRFSFNALFPKFNSLDKLKLTVADNKWDNYLIDTEKGKGKILQSIGYTPDEKERFIKETYKQICSNYIYNLEKNEHNILKFNVCVDLPTTNGHYRKTTVSLKYIPDSGEISIITIT